MMIKNNNNILNFLVILSLPILIIISPNWLKLNGVTPCWPVIFLLPFSIINKPWNSLITAFLLGIFVDSFTFSDVSYIPSLLILSILFSTYGLFNKKVELFFNIGLMAVFGTAFVGFSIWIQKIILYSVLRNNWFHSWSIYILTSEVIITGLVAPFVSSWLLIAYRKNYNKNF